MRPTFCRHATSAELARFLTRQTDGHLKILSVAMILNDDGDQVIWKVRWKYEGLAAYCP
jgi:hypothetical protein